MKKKILLSFLALLIPVSLYGQDKVEPPVWSVGDTWAWKRADGVTFEHEVVEVREDFYIVRMGRDPDLYGYDRKTMNVKLVIKEKTRQLKFDSVWGRVLDFPIFVGKNWKSTIYYKQRMETEVTFLNEFSVDGVEDITTPAGKFKCYRIHLKQTNMGNRKGGWVRFWYSPEVKTWIKRERENTGYWYDYPWTDNAQLISYKLK